MNLTRYKNNISSINNKNILSPKILIYSFFTALCVFFYTDYLGYSITGYYISILIVVSTLFLLFVDFSKGISLLFYSIFLSADHPRNIVQNVETFKGIGGGNYYSVTSSTLYGVSLAQWLFLLTFIIVVIIIIIRKKVILRNKAVKRFLLSIMIMALIMYFSMMVDCLISREILDYKEILSDHRLFLILLMSSIIGSYYILVEKEYCFKVSRDLVFIGCTSGFKTLLFILSDFYHGSPGLGFGTQPYLLLPLAFSFIFAFSHKRKYMLIVGGLLIFLGGMKISRGDILYIFIEIILFFLLSFYLSRNIKGLLQKLKTGFVLIALFVILPSSILFHLNEKAYTFLMYKTKFFTEEIWGGDLTNSPKTRVYEFKNIILESQPLYVSLVIGRGFGGYFTYEKMPFVDVLGLSDYSKKELYLKKYFKPHTFINYSLLKGGLLFLAFYVWMVLANFKNGLMILRYGDKNSRLLATFSFFFALFSLNMYWVPQLMFFFGFFTVIILEVKKTSLRHY